jgi:hypothetical protein
MRDAMGQGRRSPRTPGATAWTKLATAALVGLLAAVPAIAADAPAGTGGRLGKLFDSEETLSVTLTAPWREFIAGKGAKKRVTGTLEYGDDAGAKHVMPVAFEPRGHLRLSVCKRPPIRLILDKDAAEGTPFRGNRSLKLVTHCGNGERYEQYLAREMLAYRIYNLVTERSFRVRSLAVTYVETGGNAADGPHVGFLVEDDGALAKRNRLEKSALPRIGLEQVEPREASRFALFEYLIGNTDFAQLNGPTPERCCHNSVLLAGAPESRFYTVPYDFDSSGLVDADYAAPAPGLKIRSNRERVYRGFCAFNATLPAARAELLQLQPRILDLARAESRFTAGSRQSVVDYLTGGFDVLRSDEEFERDVIARCRK